MSIMGVKVSISDLSLEGKLGRNTPQIVWRKFNGSFKNRTINPRLLPAIIRAGRSITTWHTGYRKRDNFLLGQHLATDHDDGQVSASELMENVFVKDNAYLVHTTASHTPEKPRLRVVYILDQSVSSAYHYVRCAQAVQNLFADNSDPATHDPCRLFFGNKGAECHILGNTLSLESLARVVKEWEEERAAKRTSFKIMDTERVGDGLMRAILERSLDKVRGATNGTRHQTALVVSRTLGGYVGSQLLPQENTYQQLVEAALDSGLPESEATRVVRDGMGYGILQPLTPIQMEATNKNAWECFGL